MPSVLLPNRVLGLSVRGGGGGFPWANLPGGNALHAWDFLNNTARWNGASVGALSNTPGWSFARASAGYAQTAAGVLTHFASGELRRTDKGVLIEGARTNLCLQSQTFDNASWTKTTATVSANTTTAPDGTTTADTLIEDATAGVTHRIYQDITTTAAAYTFSVYAKKKERDKFQLRMTNSVPESCFAWFNLTTGAVGTLSGTGATSSITALGNGWYRCSLTVATALAAVNSHVIALAETDGITAYNGDGASGLYLWGAQSELGAFVSSPIPTTSSTATRAADVLTVPVSGLDYPLTLYAEFERAVDTASTEALVYLYVNGNNYSRLSVASTDAGQMNVGSGGVTQANLLSAATISVGTVSRLAGRIASNDAIVALNGVLTSADASVTVPVGTMGLYFGADGVGATPCFGYLRRAAIWPRALTDAELTAVTAA